MELHTAFGLLRAVSHPSAIINNWLRDLDHHPSANGSHGNLNNLHGMPMRAEPRLGLGTGADGQAHHGDSELYKSCHDAAASGSSGY